jgi:exonuclease SbcC
MVKKIVINNFESHEHSEIDLSPGITAIVGRTDSGKSSIFRALYWVVNNEPRGDEFIRRGTSLCSVELHLDDGTVIGRRKGKSGKESVNQYWVQRPGQEAVTYDSIGTNVPEEVWRLLGVDGFLLPGESKPSLNFSEQGASPFGVYDSGPERARKLSSFSGVDKADAAVKLLNQEIRELKKTINASTDTINTLSAQIDKLSVVGFMEELIAEAKSHVSQALSTRQKAEYLKQTKEALLDIISRAKKAKDVIAILQELQQSAPDMEEAAAHLQRLNGLKEARADMEAKLNGIRQAQQRLDSISSLEEVDFDFSMAEKCIEKVNSLKSLKDTLLKHMDAIQEVQKRINALKKEEEEAEKEYHEALQAFDVCPVCNQKIDKK